MSPLGGADAVTPAHRRLERLYEISTLLAGFTDVEETFDPVLAIASRTLPLRSAVLIEAQESRPHMFVWGSKGESVDHMQAVKAHMRHAHSYLVGGESAVSTIPMEQTEMPSLSALVSAQAQLARRLIVLPLVVANRPPFGALQIEGIEALDKADLMFVNSVANQLAVALDRDGARRRDVARREHAEEGQADAETRGATSDRHRIDAEATSRKYQALAAENARLYEEAKVALRGREQILAIVSHDLRNPLSTIVMTAGTLAKRGALPEAVGRIQRAADRMLRLIEDLLDFASIESGSLAIKPMPEDAELIIQETAANFEGALKQKGLELAVEVAPSLPLCCCDRDRVLQVLSNLVGNASKATPAGGHLTLGLSARGPDLVFTVSDDGPGISPGDVKHLFERYWRSGQAEYRGTGLGLAISRGIVFAHGGELWVETVLGFGAKFSFTIPAVDPPPGC